MSLYLVDETLSMGLVKFPQLVELSQVGEVSTRLGKIGQCWFRMKVCEDEKVQS